MYKVYKLSGYTPPFTKKLIKTFDTFEEAKSFVNRLGVGSALI